MTETTWAELLDLMVSLRAGREPYVLATVVETEGSASARPGSKALIGKEGALLAGWVGGGCAESTVRQAALKALRKGEPHIVELDLDDEVLGTGMPCGGSMRVHVEPVLPMPTLWVLGHGRLAECLCRFGAVLGFRVVVDDTPAPDRARFPDAAEIIGDDYGYERLEPAAGDAVVIATQHKGDHVSTVRALRSPASYVAVIASRKRSRLIMDFLHGEGFTTPELARLRAPAGLDLGAATPEEIALSVLSEIIMLLRRGTGRPRRDLAGSYAGAVSQAADALTDEPMAQP